MAPPARAVILLLPLLAASLGGCAVYNDLQRFLDRARGVPEVEERTLLDEEVRFAPTDTSGGTPPAPGRAGRVNFTVPPGARDLSVEVSVVFEPPATPPAPVPSPPAIPSGTPEGSVNVTIRPTSGAVTAFEFTTGGVRVFTAEAPPGGLWSAEVRATGNGAVRLFAAATVPRP